MPILKTARETKEAVITSIPESCLKIYKSVLVSDTEIVESIKGGNFQKGLNLLCLMIKEWNLTDEAGVLLPVTIDNLTKIELNDLNSLISELDIFVEAKKKTEEIGRAS